MDTVLQIGAISLVAAVLCVVVRENAKSMAMLLSLAACAVIMCLALRFFSPIASVVEQLQELSDLGGAVTAPLVKVVGIGILTQIAGGVCEDAGEKALTKAVEIAGSFLALYVTLPLVTAVMDLLEELMGG